MRDSIAPLENAVCTFPLFFLGLCVCHFTRCFFSMVGLLYFTVDEHKKNMFERGQIKSNILRAVFQYQSNAAYRFYALTDLPGQLVSLPKEGN